MFGDLSSIEGGLKTGAVLVGRGAHEISHITDGFQDVLEGNPKIPRHRLSPAISCLAAAV
jgi:hypothetical protein